MAVDSEASGVNPASRNNSQLWPQDGSNLKNSATGIRKSFSDITTLKYKKRDRFNFSVY